MTKHKDADLELDSGHGLAFGVVLPRYNLLDIWHGALYLKRILGTTSPGYMSRFGALDGRLERILLAPSCSYAVIA